MVTLSMPGKKYGEDRAFEFGVLADYAKVRPLELRVALSNVFVSMARGGRCR